MSWVPPPAPILSHVGGVFSSPQFESSVTSGPDDSQAQRLAAWPHAALPLGVRTPSSSSHSVVAAVAPPLAPCFIGNGLFAGINATQGGVTQSPATGFSGFNSASENFSATTPSNRVASPREGRRVHDASQFWHGSAVTAATTGPPGGVLSRPSGDTPPDDAQTPTASSPGPATVLLNVYYQRSITYDDKGRVVRQLGQDFTWGRRFLKDVLGVYHVGVQVGQDEYTFGSYHAPNSRLIGMEQSGIVRHEPRLPGPAFQFKESVQLGTTELSSQQVEAICADFGERQFAAKSYDRINNNCVDFSRSLATSLKVEEVPLWCYRGAAAARLLGLGAYPAAETGEAADAASGDPATAGGGGAADAAATAAAAAASYGKHQPSPSFVPSPVQAVDERVPSWVPPGEGIFQIGDAVLYLSRSSGLWIPATVLGYNREVANTAPGAPSQLWWSYKLDVQQQAPPSHVAPRREDPVTAAALAARAALAAAGGCAVANVWNAGAQDSSQNMSQISSASVGQDSQCFAVGEGGLSTTQPLEAGTAVAYLSRTSNIWVPAVIQGHRYVMTGGGAVELRYQLDVQHDADPRRVVPQLSGTVQAPSPMLGERQPALKTASPAMKVASPVARTASPAIGSLEPNPYHLLLGGAAAPPSWGSVHSAPSAAAPEAQLYQLPQLISASDPFSYQPQMLAANARPPGSWSSVSDAPPQQMQPSLPNSSDTQGTTRATQGGYCPEYWAATAEQLRELQRDTSYKVGMTTRQLVEAVIKPATAGKGLGYALLKNLPRPMLTNIMVSHAWDDEFGHLVDAVDNMDTKGAFWVAAAALYQVEDMPEVTLARQIGREVGGLLTEVLRKASLLLCVPSATCSIYKRLWCLFEMSTALQLGVKIQTVTIQALSAGSSPEACSDDGSLGRVYLDPINTREARCGVMGTHAATEDEQAIRSEITASPGGYATIDRASEELRLAALYRTREEILRGGNKEGKEPGLSLHVASAIDAICARLAASGSIAVPAGAAAAGGAVCNSSLSRPPTPIAGGAGAAAALPWNIGQNLLLQQQQHQHQQQQQQQQQQQHVQQHQQQHWGGATPTVRVHHSPRIYPVRTRPSLLINTALAASQTPTTGPGPCSQQGDATAATSTTTSTSNTPTALLKVNPPQSPAQQQSKQQQPQQQQSNQMRPATSVSRVASVPLARQFSPPPRHAENTKT